MRASTLARAAASFFLRSLASSESPSSGSPSVLSATSGSAAAPSSGATASSPSFASSGFCVGVEPRYPNMPYNPRCHALRRASCAASRTKSASALSSSSPHCSTHRVNTSCRSDTSSSVTVAWSTLSTAYASALAARILRASSLGSRRSERSLAVGVAGFSSNAFSGAAAGEAGASSARGGISSFPPFSSPSVPFAASSAVALAAPASSAAVSFFAFFFFDFFFDFAAAFASSSSVETP